MKHASLRGVSGTVSWFVGGLCLLKNRRMYKFTNQASFHLNCKFLGANFAVWFHHIKNKAPTLDSDCSELKCKCMTFCPPAWKNIYVSRSSNTPSEGAVVK